MKQIFIEVDPSETPLQEIVAINPALTGLLPDSVTDFVNQITQE